MSSKRDEAVLNAILNPFLPLGQDFDSTPLNELVDDVDVTEKVREARLLERKAVSLAEDGDLPEALEVINKAAYLAPGLPSVFNNRAQIHRLLNNEIRAFEDLNMAILLSGGRGKSGCQALCQRGLLNRKNGNDEAAIADFTRAAHLGNPFAKASLVQLNPYSALCNQMLSQVFQKIK